MSSILANFVFVDLNGVMWIKAVEPLKGILEANNSEFVRIVQGIHVISFSEFLFTCSTSLFPSTTEEHYRFQRQVLAELEGLILAKVSNTLLVNHSPTCLPNDKVLERIYNINPRIKQTVREYEQHLLSVPVPTAYSKEE